MVILLNGSTDIARKTLAEKFTKENDLWKHLPIEQISELAEMQGLMFMDSPEMSTHIACQCAQEMQKDGFHVVLTHETAEEMIHDLKKELGDSLVTVSLGESSNDDLFDHTVDTSNQSINDAYAEIQKIIEGNT